MFARGSLSLRKPMANILVAGIASQPKSKLDPRPHVYFNLAEEGGRTWRIVFFDEDEIVAVGLLAAGDALAVSGTLNLHATVDSQGRRRLAFEVVGKQVLILRSRSKAAARNTAFFFAAANGWLCHAAPGRVTRPNREIFGI
jgi:hypothetical protein